jgi:hypothetical protein
MTKKITLSKNFVDVLKSNQIKFTFLQDEIVVPATLLVEHLLEINGFERQNVSPGQLNYCPNLFGMWSRDREFVSEVYSLQWEIDAFQFIHSCGYDEHITPNIISWAFSVTRQE